MTILDVLLVVLVITNITLLIETRRSILRAEEGLQEAEARFARYTKGYPCD